MADAPAGSAARLRLALAACAVLVASCAAHQAKQQRDTDLQLISDLLPGHYDDQVQIAEDRRAGRVPPEALTLSIVQVHAGEIGVQMFYLQEMTRGTRDIKLQRLLSMGLANDQVVATVWSFTDPPRWREGDSTPELFAALQPPDLKVMRGCNLIWKKEGSRFTAANAPGKCEPGVSPGGVPQYLRMRVQLSPDELDLMVREEDAQGDGLVGHATDSYIHFRHTPGT